SARLGIGAQSVGLAEAAYREALKYANERIQFGKPIIKFPAVYEMLRLMEVKTIAIRSLLYETARFVDIYKAYGSVSEKRKLEAEERKDSKKYQRLADVFTPLLKLVSSEYCNQITYDALQIHGGAGFMKDFPIERIYRDARITTIYEGTSQLQVVAAIRGVGTHAFLNRIKEYEAEKMDPELEYLRKILQDMTGEFEELTRYVDEYDDGEFMDFHARRLVEMAGNIIMGYLLLLDSMRDEDYSNSAEIFIKLAVTENREKALYIRKSEIKDLGIFKY
ncbi:MAG: Acyl-CoA dehydrogenase C-terminal domain-containing protein, partial [Bacteroidota bacterium]